MEENLNNFMSAEINEITSALSAFQGEVEQPKLNKENPYFKSRYVDLSGVLAKIQPVLAKNSLSVAQLIVGGDLITLLSHKSGQWLKSICPIGSYKTQQERGSAITYTKRYAICAMLGIAAEIDDDGNSANDADKRQGAVKAQQTTFTPEQLKAAVGEMEAVKTEEELRSVWSKWQSVSPALCKADSEFYKVTALKKATLK